MTNDEEIPTATKSQAGLALVVPTGFGPASPVLDGREARFWDFWLACFDPKVIVKQSFPPLIVPIDQLTSLGAGTRVVVLDGQLTPPASVAAVQPVAVDLTNTPTTALAQTLADLLPEPIGEWANDLIGQSSSETTTADLRPLDANQDNAIGELGNNYVPETDPASTREALADRSADLTVDFRAVGLGWLWTRWLLSLLNQPERLTESTVWAEMTAAAQAHTREDYDATRSALSAACDLLLNARQMVAPTTLYWVDIALALPELTADSLRQRARFRSPVNLVVRGQDLASWCETAPEAVTILSQQVTDGQVELLGGAYDDRPWALLPAASRHWQLRQSQRAMRQALDRDLEHIGSRASILSPDLPRVLAKYQFRYAWHAAADGGKLPAFREAKIHWTGPDGSVAESLCRIPVDASRPASGLSIVATMAAAYRDDRAPTLVAMHWWNQTAEWFELFLRLHEYTGVFGRATTFSDYFISAYTPHKPVETRTDDYGIHASAKTTPRLLGLRRLALARASFETDASLFGIVSVAPQGGCQTDLTQLLEDREFLFETTSDTSAEPIPERVHVGDTAATAVGTLLPSTGPDRPGYLILNSLPFARRVRLRLPGIEPALPISGPIRAKQPLTDGTTAIVVDVPGWGFSWVDQRVVDSSPTSATESKLGSIASGRRLKNDYIEIEIDSKTGCLRGLWDTRTGYSRLGQQLAAAIPSRCIGLSRTIAHNGPHFAEVITTGEILAEGTRADRLARFTQRVVVYRGRPECLLSLEIEPASDAPPTLHENGFVCRWAWPDEKTVLSIPRGDGGLTVARTAEIESQGLIELRERNLSTTLAMPGIVVHRRTSARSLESHLGFDASGPMRFEFAIALDLAHPGKALQELITPAAVVAGAHGPPGGNTTGWLMKIDQPAVVQASLRPITGYDGQLGLLLRLVETEGKAVRAELRFARAPRSARLVNGRGQLIYDLHPRDDSFHLEFAAHELIHVEIYF